MSDLRRAPATTLVARPAPAGRLAGAGSSPTGMTAGRVAEGGCGLSGNQLQPGGAAGLARGRSRCRHRAPSAGSAKAGPAPHSLTFRQVRACRRRRPWCGDGQPPTKGARRAEAWQGAENARRSTVCPAPARCTRREGGRREHACADSETCLDTPIAARKESRKSVQDDAMDVPCPRGPEASSREAADGNGRRTGLGCRAARLRPGRGGNGSAG